MGLCNDKIALLVGIIVTSLTHVEERMIEIMALLVGGQNAPARQIFRAGRSEDARVKILRALLEQSPLNKDKGQEFDEVLDIFVEIKNKRNIYVHGLWTTQHETDRTFLAEPTTEEFVHFMRQREVKAKELESVLQRIREFNKKTFRILYPHVSEAIATRKGT